MYWHKLFQRNTHCVFIQTDPHSAYYHYLHYCQERQDADRMEEEEGGMSDRPDFQQRIEEAGTVNVPPSLYVALVHELALSLGFELPTLQAIELSRIRMVKAQTVITFTKAESKASFFAAGGVTLDLPGVMRLILTPINQLHHDAGLHGPLSVRTTVMVPFTEALAKEVITSLNTAAQRILSSAFTSDTPLTNPLPDGLLFADPTTAVATSKSAITSYSSLFTNTQLIPATALLGRHIPNQELLIFPLLLSRPPFEPLHRSGGRPAPGLRWQLQGHPEHPAASHSATPLCSWSLQAVFRRPALSTHDWPCSLGRRESEILQDL